VVAFVFGRRTHASFRRLLAGLARAGWAVEQWFADAWGAYEACLPTEQRQTGNAPLQRLERKRLTLRTRLRRLTRRTSYFSKKQFFHVWLDHLIYLPLLLSLSVDLTHDPENYVEGNCHLPGVRA